MTILKHTLDPALTFSDICQCQLYLYNSFKTTNLTKVPYKVKGRTRKQQYAIYHNSIDNKICWDKNVLNSKGEPKRRDVSLTMISGADLIWGGELFHEFRAVTAKARSPLVTSLVLGTTRSSWVAELSSSAGVWTGRTVRVRRVHINMQAKGEAWVERAGGRTRCILSVVFCYSTSTRQRRPPRQKLKS